MQWRTDVTRRHTCPRIILAPPPLDLDDLVANPYLLLPAGRENHPTGLRQESTKQNFLAHSGWCPAFAPKIIVASPQLWPRRSLPWIPFGTEAVEARP